MAPVYGAPPGETTHLGLQELYPLRRMGQTGGGGGEERDITYSKNGPRAHDYNVDPQGLWFKAAVIAVPIAGGFILVLLVLLAVRMLRADTQRHRRLIQVRRRERSLTKAQLYVTDHFSDVSAKSDAGPACPLFKPHRTAGAGAGGGGVAVGACGVKGNRGMGVCRDSNFPADRAGRLYEQVHCDGSLHAHQHVPAAAALTTWSKVTSPDLASVV